jgi:hypothetical protein
MSASCSAQIRRKESSDRTAIIQGYDVERVLSNMMPTTAIAFCAVVAGIACSLSRTPAQLSCLRRRRHPAMSDIGPLLGVKETYADVGRLRFFWRRAGSRAETMPSMRVSSSVSFDRRYQCGFAHRDAPVNIRRKESSGIT